MEFLANYGNEILLLLLILPVCCSSYGEILELRMMFEIGDLWVIPDEVFRIRAYSDAFEIRARR